MTFYAQLSPRLNKQFSEVSWALGPLQIGVTGAGTYNILYGSDWLTLIDVNRRLEAYQLIDGQWVNQSESLLLPQIFDTQLPAGVKRLTHAFDQAARIICAYEDEAGIIQVTRWDPIENQYLQNVSFSGADPCLLMQTTVDYEVQGSDIWLFYRRGSTIYWRRQADNYAIENTLFSDSQIGVLDRAQALIYRYQLLVSDSDGAPLSDVLRSALFPIYGADIFAVSSEPVGVGDYVREVLVPELEPETMSVSGEAPGTGAYEEAVIIIDVSDELSVTGQAPGTGDYPTVVLTPALEPELISVNGEAPGTGSYIQEVIPYDEADAIEAFGELPGTGLYEAV